ncbi:glyoxalase [Streptomyces tateyamensis]|uniref:Glyoxalase n=1 Tax=Streptomyces tateyamensis TaxID=565073 RepID=A0A2V4NNM7_9ACTN|nr:VOC family protein [Streptomyces tateyamensis]PYC87898.1 glyoxalase [Streptomyces tateyamensis]
MTYIENVTLDVADETAAEEFYRAAFGLAPEQLRVRAAAEPSEGFRGYTLSLTVAQPGDADSFVASAVAAGATVVKPAAKSLWGYGAVLQAPDGALWKLATSAKKDKGPVTREIESMVLLLGVEDITASKKFYVEQGLTVGKSFAKTYVEFASGDSPVKLGLYRRKALAKDAGVPAAGAGSHRITIGGGTAGFTDLDGFAWQAAA